MPSLGISDCLYVPWTLPCLSDLCLDYLLTVLNLIGCILTSACPIVVDIWIVFNPNIDIQSNKLISICWLQSLLNLLQMVPYSAHKCLCYSSKNHNIQKTKMDSWDNSISEPILCWVPGKFLIGLAWGHTHYTSPTRNHLTIPSVHRTCLSSDRGNGIMRAIEINSYKPVCAELEAALWVRWILIWRSQMASGAGPTLLLMYWPSK